MPKPEPMLGPIECNTNDAALLRTIIDQLPLIVFWILSAIAAVVLWRRGEDLGQPSPSDDR